MTDQNERRPDLQSDDAQNADETLTQWVPADRPPSPAPPGTEEPGGWFTPAAPPADDQPRWANWDQPWEHADEPFDQTAQEPPPPVYPGPHVPSPDPLTAPAQPSSPKDVRTPSASWANLHALRLLAQVACPLLLLVGLSFDDGAARNGWHDYTAWAVFAAVCAVIQLAPLAGRSLGLTAENAWFLAAVGTAGLVGYWVIIVLPGVSSNTGFAQTLAAGFAVIGLWLSPGRRV